MLTSRNGLAVFFLAPCLSLASAAEVCPSQLEYTIAVPGEEFEAAVRVDFQEWVQARESRFELVGIGHYARHPRTETALVLLDFEHAPPIRMREGEESDGAWVACYYDGTDIRLIRQLPNEISYCQYDRSAKALDCLYHAPSEPESIVFGNRPSSHSEQLAVLVVGSVRECRLTINDVDAGLLHKNRDRAFNVAHGEVLIKCAAKDGVISQGSVHSSLGKDTPYRVAW